MNTEDDYPVMVRYLFLITQILAEVAKYLVSLHSPNVRSDYVDSLASGTVCTSMFCLSSDSL